MALILSDRVQETANAPGTGNVSLLGAVTGFQTFSAGVGNGNTCYYTIADQGGANWEVGIGTYSASGNTLARTTVLSSSNSGSLVNFSSGTQTVFVTYPAEKSVNLDSSGNVSALGTVTSATWQATTVATNYGGTGLTGFNANGALYANTSSTVTTGTLPIASGGTNSTATPTAGAVIYGNGASYAVTSTGTSGQLLQSNGSSAPTWTTISAVPIGSLQYFAGPATSGYPGSTWLKCDGSIYSQSTYSTLFSRIGLINNLLSPTTTASITTTQIAPKPIFSTTGGTTVGANITGIIYQGGSYYCGVGNGYYYTSTDAQNWTNQTASGPSLTGQRYWVYGNGFFVVVTGATASISSDCGGWSAGGSATNAFTSIAYAPGQTYQYIAGSDVSTVAGANLWGSTVSTAASFTLLTSNSTSAINYVAYGNPIYAYVDAANKNGRSLDAVTWSYIANPISGSTTAVNGTSATAGAGIYVAAGTGGYLSTSTNATSWTARTSGTASNINALTYGTVFVFGTDLGGISTSTDGITWSARTSGTASTIGALTYAGALTNKYLYGGAGGVLASSTDAITWTARTSGTTSLIYALTYGTVYVYAGAGGAYGTSTDGVTWTTPQPATTSTIFGVTYATGIYCAVGAGGLISTSTDAVTWTSRTSGTISALNAVIYGTQFVAAGAGGRLQTSTDGITWTGQTSGTVSIIYALVYGSALTNAYVYGGAGGALRTSTDGVTWTARTSGTTSNITALAYAPGQTNAYVCGGSGGVLRTSTDGVTWTSRASNTNQIINGLAYGNSTYVYVGGNGAVATSTNGTTWVTPTGTTASPAVAVSAVGYASGQTNQYLYATSAGVYTSTDTVTWTLRSGSLGGATGLAYGNGVYVSCGVTGAIYTSTDGVTWTSQTSGTTSNLAAVAYGANTTNKYVAGGTNVSASSTDGVTWSVNALSVIGSITSITYGNNLYVGVTSTGYVSFSASGVIVDANSVRINSGLNSIAYGNNLFVAVGSNGELFTSVNGFEGWIRRNSGTVFDINAVTFNSSSNTFVYTTSNGYAGTSTDGITWTVTNIHPAYLSITKIVSTGSSYLTGGANSILGTSTNATSWSWIGSQTGSNILAVYFDSNSSQFVASGTNYFATSTNGRIWSLKPYSNFAMQALTYGTKFVSVGTVGTVYTSTDANTWSSTGAGVNVNILGLAYGNSTYVMVGNSGTLKTSTDAITWTQRFPVQNPAYGAQGLSVSYNSTAGLFLVGLTSGRTITSTDGITWNMRSPGQYITSAYLGYSGSTANIVAISGAGSVFLAVDGSGNLASSTDGNTFNWYSFPANSTQYFGYLNNLFVWTTSQSIYTSTDAITWTYRASPHPALFNIQGSVQYGGGLYVACSSAGTIGNQQFGLSASSTDAITWTVNTTYSPTALTALAYGGGSNAAWTAVGASGVYVTSTNGTTWEYPATSTSISTYSLQYQNGSFFVLQGNGSILTSTNGLYWKITNPGNYTTTTSLNANPIYSLTYGTKIVAGGSGGRVYTSTDAVNWSQSPVIASNYSNSYAVLGLAYGASTYVYVGTSGTIASSTDAVTWTTRTSGTSTTLNAVVYANNTFVTVGTNIALTSTDGITWTSRTIGSGNWAYLTYFNSLFYATNTGTTVKTSTDGITWNASQVTPGSVNGLNYYNNDLLVSSLTQNYYSPDGYGYLNLGSAGSTIKGIAGGGGYVVAGGATMTDSSNGLRTYTVLNYNTSTQFAVPNLSTVLMSATSTTQLFYNLPISSTCNLYVKAL